MNNFFIRSKFYWTASVIIACFCISFILPFLFVFCQLLLGLFLCINLIDWYLLFLREINIHCRREMASIWSMGYEHAVDLHIQINTDQGIYSYYALEDIPSDISQLDVEIKGMCDTKLKTYHRYHIIPKKRGMYHFGKSYIFIYSKIGFIERRFTFDHENSVKVYPAIAQFKDAKFDFVIKNTKSESGNNKIRKLGHGYEFEHIKNYVRGDDYRSINWKATGRINALMVNQYEDDQSQGIYHLLDNSRVMNFKSNGMSLLDYSINAILILSKIIIDKKDKIGYLSFSKHIDQFVKADKKSTQLRLILDRMYNERSNELESNYEALYHAIRNQIKQRSLLFLYTNFESISALERQLPILRSIARHHVLVIIFFENEELNNKALDAKNQTIQIDSYDHAVLEHFILEKAKIVSRLHQENIHALSVTPNQLGVSLIEKYLSLKSKGI